MLAWYCFIKYQENNMNWQSVQWDYFEFFLLIEQSENLIDVDHFANLILVCLLPSLTWYYKMIISLCTVWRLNWVFICSFILINCKRVVYLFVPSLSRPNGLSHKIFSCLSCSVLKFLSRSIYCTSKAGVKTVAVYHKMG